MLLACKCLNIKLYIQGKETDFEQLKHISNEEDVPTGFFPSGEVEVVLDSRGVKLEHSYLVHRRKLGNYVIFRCLNCGLDTHALPDSGNQVIVNNSVLNDMKVLERLMNSGDFSKVFHMVLPNKDMSYTGVMPDPGKGAYESLQTHLNSITQQLSNYLNQEEADMEDRIRIYEEAQKAEFEQFKSKLKEEKKQMISLLLSASQIDPTGVGSGSTMKDTSNRSSIDRKSPAKKKSLCRVKSLPPTIDSNDDAMFSFDGFAEDQDATLYGEDASLDEEDEEEDDEDTFEPQTPRARPTQKAKLTYSSSVPISVPTWGKQDVFFDDEEEDLPSDPNQIAASMQALAQSITDDNRYIFGDRPRPRLNTGDFTMNR